MKTKKLDFESLTKLVKSKNFMIAMAVFTLTIFSLGVSYASFFSVKSNATNQTVTTGTLAVSYGQESSSILRDSMNSMSDSDGMSSGESSIIYIQNTGTLNSTFTLNIGYDMENFMGRSGYTSSDSLTPLDYIMLAVYEYNGVGAEDTLLVGPISVADLPIYRLNNSDPRYNRYSVLFNTVGSITSGNATKTYRIKMWLSDKAIPAASYSYFYINTEIVAEVENAKMNYNLNGKVTDKAGTPLSGAVISFHNKSIVATTDSTGAYNLSGIYPGVYNVDITYNNKIYSGNLTVEEGDANALVSFGSNFTGTSIYESANNYGTTISKIIKTNNINTYSSAVDLTGAGTYKLSPSYKFTGGGENNISGLTFALDTDNGTYTMNYSS